VAQQVVIKLEDDLDGGDANETLTFGLDGVSYEIDLSDAHAAELRDELAAYVAAARRVGGRKVHGAGNGVAAPAGDRERARAIREWARGEGIEVSARGRISSELAAQYEEAQRAPVIVEEPAPRRRASRKKAAAK
jgi:hypothetical protein